MSNSFYRTEMIANLYRKSTGRLAPFKDSPSAAYAGEEREKENRLVYEEWRKNEMLTAALDYCVELEEKVKDLENDLEERVNG